MENAATNQATPTTVNSSVRTREYLTTAEIERLMAAARKSSRYGHRDATKSSFSHRHLAHGGKAVCRGPRNEALSHAHES